MPLSYLKCLRPVGFVYIQNQRAQVCNVLKYMYLFQTAQQNCRFGADHKSQAGYVYKWINCI